MSKTIFLHIGPRKTGTTYLQGVMWANKKALREQGILVPGRRQSDHFAAGSQALDRRPRRPRPRGTGGWIDLVAEINRDDAPTAIVSDERLAWATADQTADMLRSLAGHDVHVIYGVREIGGLLSSIWQQQAKRAPVKPSAEWVEQIAAGEHPWFARSHDPSETLSRWDLPPDRIHVLLVPGRGAGPSELWYRFAGIIGAPRELPNNPRRTNESLGRDEIELVLRVHRELGHRPFPTGLESIPRPSRVGAIMRDVVSQRLLARRTSSPAIRLSESTRPFVDKMTETTRSFLHTCDHPVIGDIGDVDVAEHRFQDGPAAPDEHVMLDHAVHVVAGLIGRTIKEEDRNAQQLADDPRPPTPSPRQRPSVIPQQTGREQLVEHQVSRVVNKARRTTRRARRRSRIAIAERTGRTYYIHIGATKTGSTHLQQLIWQNRETLMRDGVYVPGRSQRDHFSAGSDLRGRPNPAQSPNGGWKGGWERLVQDAEQSGYRKILITNELLAPMTTEQVRTMMTRLQDDEVHIIYAARDLPGILTSLWQQQLQTFPIARWEVWLQKVIDGKIRWIPRAHDIGDVLERWRAGGVEHVHVITSPRPGSADTELWRRLQSIVGWSRPTRTDRPRANPSLGYSNAELLRRVQHAINRRVPQHRRTVLTKDYLANEILMKLPQTDGVRVPERFRPWFEAETDRRVAAIADARNHVVGDLGDVAVNESKFTAAVAEPDESIMLESAATLIAALVQNLADLRGERSKQLNARA